MGMTRQVQDFEVIDKVEMVNGHTRWLCITTEDGKWSGFCIFETEPVRGSKKRLKTVGNVGCQHHPVPYSYAKEMFLPDADWKTRKGERTI